MYFWKIEKLKEELVQKGLNQSELFKYIFIYVFLSDLTYEVMCNFIGQESNNIDYVESILNMIIVGSATYFCYAANGGADGTDFAERYFSIGFVVSIRCMILLIPIVGAMEFVFWNNEDVDMSTTWYDAVFTISWTIFIYWRIIYHINQVAKRANA